MAAKDFKGMELADLLGELPEELVERHGLEELPEAEARKRAIGLLGKRADMGVARMVGYHTTDLAYRPGDRISASASKGLYKGRLFYSRSLDSAFSGDGATRCYKVEVEGAHRDPEDLTGRDWFYTLSPAKVLEEVQDWRQYRK